MNVDGLSMLAVLDLLLNHGEVSELEYLNGARYLSGPLVELHQSSGSQF